MGIRARVIKKFQWIPYCFVFLNKTMKTTKKEGSKILPDIPFLSPARLVQDPER